MINHGKRKGYSTLMVLCGIVPLTSFPANFESNIPVIIKVAPRIPFWLRVSPKVAEDIIRAKTGSAVKIIAALVAVVCFWA